MQITSSYIRWNPGPGWVEDLRYRIPHAAARMTRGDRQRRLNRLANVAWATDIATS